MLAASSPAAGNPQQRQACGSVGRRASRMESNQQRLFAAALARPLPRDWVCLVDARVTSRWVLSSTVVERYQAGDVVTVEELRQADSGVWRGRTGSGWISLVAPEGGRILAHGVDDAAEWSLPPAGGADGTPRSAGRRSYSDSGSDDERERDDEGERARRAEDSDSGGSESSRVRPLASEPSLLMAKHRDLTQGFRELDRLADQVTNVESAVAESLAGAGDAKMIDAMAHAAMAGSAMALSVRVTELETQIGLASGLLAQSCERVGELESQLSQSCECASALEVQTNALAAQVEQLAQKCEHATELEERFARMEERCERMSGVEAQLTGVFEATSLLGVRFAQNRKQLVESQMRTIMKRIQNRGIDRAFAAWRSLWAEGAERRQAIAMQRSKLNRVQETVEHIWELWVALLNSGRRQRVERERHNLLAKRCQSVERQMDEQDQRERMLRAQQREGHLNVQNRRIIARWRQLGLRKCWDQWAAEMNAGKECLMWQLMLLVTALRRTGQLSLRSAMTAWRSLWLATRGVRQENAERERLVKQEQAVQSWAGQVPEIESNFKQQQSMLRDREMTRVLFKMSHIAVSRAFEAWRSHRQDGQRRAALRKKAVLALLSRTARGAFAAWQSFVRVTTRQMQRDALREIQESLDSFHALAERRLETIVDQKLADRLANEDTAERSSHLQLRRPIPARLSLSQHTDTDDILGILDDHGDGDKENSQATGRQSPVALFALDLSPLAPRAAPGRAGTACWDDKAEDVPASPHKFGTDALSPLS